MFEKYIILKDLFNGDSEGVIVTLRTDVNPFVWESEQNKYTYSQLTNEDFFEPIGDQIERYVPIDKKDLNISLRGSNASQTAAFNNFLVNNRFAIESFICDLYEKEMLYKKFGDENGLYINRRNRVYEVYLNGDLAVYINDNYEYRFEIVDPKILKGYKNESELRKKFIEELNLKCVSENP